MRSFRRRSAQRQRGLRWTLVGLALVLASTGAHALYKRGDLWPESSDDITRISVCFIVSGELTTAEDTRQRALVQQVLAATWARWMKIEYSGFKTCPVTPPNETMAVTLDGDLVNGAGDIPHQTKHPGLRGYKGKNTPMYGMLWIAGASDRRARNVVTHEFGHALSFEHEQSRPDAGGFCVNGDIKIDGGTIVTSEYDDMGTMNYCATGGYLSLLDIRGAQSLYGKSAAGLWLEASPAISALSLL